MQPYFKLIKMRRRGAGECPLSKANGEYRRRSLRPLVRALDGGDMSSMLEGEKDPEIIEARAMVAYFLPDVMAIHHEWASQNPSLLGICDVGEPILPYPKGFDFEEHCEGEVFPYWQLAVECTWMNHIEKWVDQKKNEVSIDPNYDRYRKVATHFFKERIKRGMPDMPSKRLREINGDEAALMHMKMGSHTALDVITQFIKLTPQVYMQQFGKPLPDDFFTRNPHMPEDIRRFASSFINVFIWVMKQTRGQGKRGKYNENVSLDPSFMEFTGEEGNRQIQFRPDWLKYILKDYYKIGDPPLTKCPALIAQGEEKGVIEELWDWVLATAEIYYLPSVLRGPQIVPPRVDPSLEFSFPTVDPPVDRG